MTEVELHQIVLKVQKKLINYSQKPDWFMRRFYNADPLVLSQYFDNGFYLGNDQIFLDVAIMGCHDVNGTVLFEVSVSCNIFDKNITKVIPCSEKEIYKELKALIESFRGYCLTATFPPEFSWANLNQSDLKYVIQRIKGLKTDRRDCVKRNNLEEVKKCDNTIELFKTRLNQVSNPELKPLISLIEMLET